MNYIYNEDTKRFICCGCGRDAMEYHKRNCNYNDKESK